MNILNRGAGMLPTMNILSRTAGVLPHTNILNRSVTALSEILELPRYLTDWLAIKPARGFLALVSTLAVSPLYASSTTVQSVGLFTHDPIPGGIAVINLGPSAERLPQAYFNDHAIAVIRKDDLDWAIIGIGLSIDPGKQTLQVVEADNATREVHFVVKPHEYPEQRITLRDTSKVNPSVKDLKRIRREGRRKGQQSVAGQLLAEPFLWPVGGRITSPFGLRRFFNNQQRRPHVGIDIAAAIGTPIAAPADGIVANTGDFFFNGKSVIIEHGLGLKSVYAHLDSIAVQVGDTVSTGQLLGTVGATGRVTGAHLHWSIGLNGEWVNPLLLVDSW